MGDMAVFYSAWFAVWLVFVGIPAASMWMIFEKAGRPGWAALIPVLNAIVWQRITGRPLWWGLLLLVPVVALGAMVAMSIGMARCFGKGAGFGVGIALLGVVFLPILALSDAEYQPPDLG